MKPLSLFAMAVVLVSGCASPEQVASDSSPPASPDDYRARIRMDLVRTEDIEDYGFGVSLNIYPEGNRLVRLYDSQFGLLLPSGEEIDALAIGILDASSEYDSYGGEWVEGRLRATIFFNASEVDPNQATMTWRGAESKITLNLTRGTGDWGPDNSGAIQHALGIDDIHIDEQGIVFRLAVRAGETSVSLACSKFTLRASAIDYGCDCSLWDIRGGEYESDCDPQLDAGGFAEGGIAFEVRNAAPPYELVWEVGHKQVKIPITRLD